MITPVILYRDSQVVFTIIVPPREMCSFVECILKNGIELSFANGEPLDLERIYDSIGGHIDQIHDAFCWPFSTTEDGYLWIKIKFS